MSTGDPRIEAASIAIQHVLRRNAVGQDEAEDFRSWAYVKLLENDSAILRKWEGRSKLSTYLITVVARLFLDYRRAKWSRWRPSAGAKRLGEVAVQLETLVYRDGHRFDDALVLLRERFEVEHSDQELEDLFAAIKPRQKPQFEGGESTEHLAGSFNAANRAERAEAVRISEQIATGLDTALGELPAEDAAMVRLRFGEGMSVASIARRLGLEQRSLYSRFDRVLRKLRESMQAKGLEVEQVRDALSWEDLELSVLAPPQGRELGSPPGGSS